MTDKQKRNALCALILNILVVVMECLAFRLSAAKNGTSLVRFYTEDSNLLAGIACLLTAICFIRRLKNGASIPIWVSVLKYAAVCCLTLTFLVVLFVLGPMTGSTNGFLSFLFKGSMLYQHFLCPILLLVSFFLFEKDSHLEKTDKKWALLPTLLYAVIIITLNITRTITGPYPFLRVYEQPVWASILWIILILGAACLISSVILTLFLAGQKKQPK